MRKQLAFLIILITLLAIVIVLKWPVIGSTASSNFGWIKINEQLAEDEIDIQDLEIARERFEEALESDPLNTSAGFGLGLAYALQGDTDKAYDSWLDSLVDAELLKDYGLKSQEKGDLNIALSQFRAAEAVAPSANSEGQFLAGTICHRALSSQHRLSESNKQYCADYFDARDGNLIVNDSFSLGSLIGWKGQSYFFEPYAAEIDIESNEGPSDFAVRLEGYDKSNHYGLYQTLELTPGDKLQFSGRFKASEVDNLNAQILYIAWQQEDGTINGNYGYQLSESTDWTEFERTFALPQDSKSTVEFYPILFSGEGSVWFDNIRLTHIHE